MDINTKYKSSVFSLLFNDPDILRELYCALEGVALSNEVPVTINTLSDVLFMDRINDISFEIGGKLVVLIEHQSTINPNMALRFLIYIARVYEKIVQDKKIYSSKKIVVPKPEFFVLYNGTEPHPEESVLNLSDAFDTALLFGLPEKINSVLELTVKVININEGKNEGIAKKCRTLAQYSAFIAKVREYIKDGLIHTEAIKKAVIYCRNNDILKLFLEQNASEVMNMLITEWNWDDAKEVWQDEAREDGREEKALEIAQKMKNARLTITEIEEFTGLSSDTIKHIK